jgi:16S rRNA (cytosine1402-N4)-methyltransferase
MERPSHVPVMVERVLAHLRPERGGLFFDGTLGAGGHAEAILRAGPAARVLAVDRDPEARREAVRRLEPFGARARVVAGDFADAAEELDATLAGALLDLGVSSRHLDDAARGFSFRPGTPLDMRMAGSASTEPSAAELLNTLDENEIADILYYFGEERRSRRMAAEIIRRREEAPFRTSEDLLAVIDAVLGPRADAQDRARIFQALRIAVNRELESLDRALPRLRDLLEPEGVFVVLSYHSLEDRRVKDAFREWSRSCVCPPELPVCRCRGRALGTTLTRKPERPDAQEVGSNPRARSARLRAWRKAA